MKISTYFARFYLFILFLLLALLSLVWLGRGQAFAQQEDGPLTPIMERFLKDQASEPPTTALTPLALTPCVGGQAGIYPCNNVDLMAFMPLNTIGGGSGNDIWGWTDPLDGKEYALMGRTSGTSFVDISDPENPVYLGNLPTHTSNSSWRDIKVYNNYAFIVSEASGHGMQVFDLTELRTVVSPPVTFAETAHYNGFGGAHNIVINEDSGYAYGVGTNTCSGGLHMVDISNPLVPSNAGCFSGDGYTHDAQCVNYAGPDLDHQGKEICFNSNTDTLTIVDVTNKNAPVQLSRTGYTGVDYTHQGWLTEDQTHFLLGDEGDETGNGHNTRTYIWNVSDLDAPVNFNNYTAATPAIDHNMYIKGDLVYQSNYRAGLRILDISQVAAGTLTEEAFFDTYPASDSPNFSGTWSNYPYFDSGIVIVSGIGEGLFILRPTLTPDFTIDATPTSQSICVSEDAVYTINVGQLGSFPDPVTLSASGEPAGTTVNFSVNGQVPPYASDLTIGNTAVAAPGSYDIDVVGVAPTATHTVTVGLEIGDTPGTATLLAPADGAADVSVTPTFDWSDVADADSYDLEVADDAGFTNIVYTASETSSQHTLAGELEHDTMYYWRVTANNACGPGTTTAAFSFHTAIEVTYGVSLAADEGALSALPGTAVTYTLHITNQGNVTDTFTIDVSSIWVATPSAFLVQVAPGQAGILEVYVTVPGDAMPGDDDVATVTAISQGDTAVSAATTLTTTALGEEEMVYIYLPVMVKP